MFTMIWTTPRLDGARLPSLLEDSIVNQRGIRHQTPIEESCTAVDKLNVDLLYRIFWMNANMEEEGDWVNMGEDLWGLRALITLRRTSQVCHLWREIILSSSSIWARAFDLQLLDQESDIWREEVLRRTGKAFLHVKGTVRGHHRETREFFERIVVDHWPRIRVLDVEIYHPKMFRPEVWDVLTRPAPILHSLSLRFRPCTLAPISLPHGSIFDNSAPSLREFFVEQLTFDPQSLWLGRLRKFGVYPTKNTPFTASQILEIISHMPLLESLAVGNAFPEENHDSPDAVQLQPIHLPRLSEIVIPEMELKVAIAILGKIIPRTDCTLDIFCKQRLDRGVDNPSVAAEEEAAKVVLMRYITSFFGSHVVSLLSLRHFCGVFTFQNQMKGVQMGSSQQRRFRISIDHYNLSLLFDIFSSCRYPEVKALEFCLDQSNVDAVKPSPSITPFLQQFKSVETLSVDRLALHHLNNLPEEVTFLFPSLRQIKMVGRIYYHETRLSRLYNTLARFMRRCVAAGVSIQTLDLAGCKALGEDPRNLGKEFSKEFGVEIHS